MSDSHLAKVMQALELSPDHMDLLRSYVRSGSLLVDAGASPWAAMVVREFQEDSWLTVGAGLAQVESGTRPGDSLADIVFSFLFGAVLHRIRDAMLDAGYDVKLPWSAEWYRCLNPAGPPDELVAPIDVSWMDDLALLLAADDPATLIESVRGSSAKLIDECLKALLHPNLSPGKSEAIVSLVGRHSRTIRAELFRDSEPSLALPSTLWPSSRLRLVSKYKHLGGVLHCSGSLIPELKTRCALAWQAFRKHRRLVFASPVVTHREKALLFHSLVLSSLLYGAGTWSEASDAVVGKLQATLLAMARQMLRPTFSFETACHLGACKVLATARIPSAQVLLHVERLRHLAVITRVAPEEFWAVLHFGASWCSLAKSSLDWLVDKLEIAGKAQPQLTDWRQVLTTLLDAPRTWKKWVRLAQRTALLEELWQAEAQHYHGLLFRSLLARGATATGLASELPTGEVCAPCQQSFRDLRSWSHHAFKRHGRVREARLVAQGSQCQVCLRHFATTFRLSNHLEHSRACLAALVQQGQYQDVAPGRGSRGFKDGRDVQMPAVTACGPHAQWSGEGFIPEPDRPDPGVLDGLAELFGQPSRFSDIDSLFAAVRRVFLGVCLQRSRLRATAVEWQRQLAEELSQDEEVSIQWASWHMRIASWLVSIDFATWLVPDSHTEEPTFATYRDCALMLPWLSFDPDALPICCEVLDLGLRVIGADNRLFGQRLKPQVVYLSHAQCIQSPGLLDFGLWTSEQPPRVIGFCLLGLLSSLAAPTPLRNFKSLCPQLGRLRLLADLVRGVFHLWTHGCPAFLISAPFDCPGLAAVKNAAPVSSRHGGIEIISNFQGPIPFSLSFTL